MDCVIFKQSDNAPFTSETPCVDKARESSELFRDLSGTLIVSGHQPTFLPYPGFFYRMYHSNIIDVCPYDPFSRHNDRYQHRVKIGKDSNWRWLTLPIETSNGGSIMEARLKTDFMDDRWRILQQVYGDCPLWENYKEALHEMFSSYKYLWELKLPVYSLGERSS